MTIPVYDIMGSADAVSFHFVSEGQNGPIHKAVLYTKTDLPNVWNLGFGDFDVNSGLINDLSVSDSGDSAKILATLASRRN